jgi:hypothetical protein
MAAACTTTGTAGATALCQLLLPPCSRRWRRIGRLWLWLWQAWAPALGARPSGLTRAWPSSSVTPSLCKPSRAARPPTPRAMRPRWPCASVGAYGRRPLAIPRPCPAPPPLMRTRAALVAHVHKPHRPSNVPESGTQSASKANGAGVAARCAAPAVPQSIAGALALRPFDDQRRGAVALASVQAAPTMTPTRALCDKPGRGSASAAARVRLSVMHAMDRVPTVQAGVSSCRLGQWAQAAAGPRGGPPAQKAGTLPASGPLPRQRRGACASRQQGHKIAPAGSKNTPRGKPGPAWRPSARRLCHAQAPNGLGYGAVPAELGAQRGGADASLATPALGLARADVPSGVTASLHAQVRLGLVSQSPRQCLDLHSGACTSGASRPKGRGRPLARA